LEEKLHQAERLAALGEMIAGISHEIRNPLGIIRSTAELLHDLRKVNDSNVFRRLLWKSHTLERYFDGIS